MKERNCKNQKKSLVLCDCYLQVHQLSMSYQFGFRCLWYTSVTCTFTVSIVSTEDTRRSSSTSCTAWPLPVTLAQGWVEDHAHRESCLLHYVYTLTLFAFLWCVLHMWKTESQGFVFGFFFFFYWFNTSSSFCSEESHMVFMQHFVAKATSEWKEILKLQP